MKKYVIVPGLLLFILLTQQARGQIGQIPQVVRENFRAQYPRASGAVYSDKFLEIDISFLDSGYHCMARYTMKGDWENTLKRIKSSQLPREVSDGYSKSKYSSGWQLDDVYEVEIPDNLLEYKLVVEKNQLIHKNLYFSVQGRLLSDNLTF